MALIVNLVLIAVLIGASLLFLTMFAGYFAGRSEVRAQRAKTIDHKTKRFED